MQLSRSIFGSFPVGGAQSEERAAALRARAGRLPGLLLAALASVAWFGGGAGPAAAAPAREIGVTLEKRSSGRGAAYFNLLVTFSEEVVGLALDDLSATNAELITIMSATGEATGNLRSWFVETRPAASGTVTIDLRGGAARNPLGTRDSRPARFVWDREGPQISITGPGTIQQNSDGSWPTGDFTLNFDQRPAITYGMLFSGWVNYSRNKFRVANGAITGMTGNARGPLVLTVSVRPSAAGTVRLTVPGGTYQDSDGNTSAEASGSATAAAYVPPNRAPEITDPGDRAYTQGEAITAFDLAISDPDGDTPTVGVTGLPSGLAYSASTKKVSGTVAADAAVQDYTVTITANDGNGGEASETFTITVNQANRQPVITDPGDRAYTQGEAITAFAIEVSDPDGDTPTVGVSGLPSGLAYSSSTKQVSGTVAADAAVQDYTVTITANDGVTAAVSETFTITVNRANRPPVITDPGDRAYTQGEAITAFAIAVSDPDGDTPTVDVSGLPSGLAYSASTKQVSGTVAADAAVQDYTVTITANDSVAAAVSETFTITVNRANRPPVITDPGDRAYAQGEAITAFAIAVSDPDGDAPTVGVSGLPTGLSWSTSTKKVSGTVATDAAIRAYTVTITANDGIAAAVRATFTVTVSRANHAPTITHAGDRSFAQGESVHLDITGYDQDDDALSLGVSGLPAGLQCPVQWSLPAGTAACEITGAVAADAEAKDYTVTITLNDGFGEVTDTFTITVTAAEAAESSTVADPNAAPVITAPANRSYRRNETITAFDITATDADDDALTIGVTGLPAGLSYSGATGQVSGTVAASAALGPYTAKITANDGIAAEVSATFSITVTRANREPRITHPGDRTFTQGETIAPLDITIYDDDGGSPTLSVSGLPAGLRCPAQRALPAGTAACEIEGTVASDAETKDYPVTVTASDGIARVSATFTITVETPRANDEPRITHPGDRTFTQGETIPRLDITIYDDDRDSLTLEVSGLPSGLRCPVQGGLPAGTAACEIVGTVASDAEAKDYTVTVASSDGIARVTSTFTITIRAAETAVLSVERNSAPEIANPGDRSYAQGLTISPFAIGVTDADDDSLTVTVTGLPAGLDHSETAAEISGTVDAEARLGAHPVTITASDGVNAEVTATFTITITASGSEPPRPVGANASPVITAPADRGYRRGEEVTAFGIEVSDPDGDPVTVRLSGLPAGLSYAGGEVQGVVAEDAETKAHRVTITANDGQTPEVTAAFTITVRDAATGAANAPPRISLPHDRAFRPAETVPPFYAGVTDEDGDPLRVGLTGLPAGLAHRIVIGQRPDGESVAAVEFEGTIGAGAAPGDYPVTVVARDGVHDPVAESFMVTIRPAESTPGEESEPGESEPDEPLFTVQRGPDLLYRVGERIEPEILPPAKGGVGALRYEIGPTLPEGLVFDDRERELTGTPTTKQRRTGYRLRAVDRNGATAVLRFTITIVDPPVVTGVRISSTPKQGDTYRNGEDIEAEATFDHPVVADGTPTLEWILEVGGRRRAMEFAGADGAILRFRYRVVRRDLDPNGVSLPADALTITGGRLTDTMGTDADLSHPALPDQPGHRVNGAPDGRVPALTSLRLTSRPRRDDTYRSGETIEALAEFDDPVAMEEVPRLALRIGDTVREMDLADTRQAGFLYRYLVVPTDRDPNGVSLAANALPTGAGWLSEAFEPRAAAVYAVLRDQPGHMVDGAPQAAGPLPDLRLTLGAAPAVVPVAGAFEGAATYAAESSAPEVAAVSLEGRALTVTPVSDGSATVTVFGRNAGGAAEAAFGVTVVTAAAEVEVVGDALAGLGRSALASAAAAIGERLRPSAGASTVSLAGRTRPDGSAGSAAAADFGGGLPGAAGRSVFDDLRSGSAFSLTHRSAAAAETDAGTGARWTFWGAGDRQSFRGAFGAGSRYDGAPVTAYLGADVEAGRWLAGLAVSRTEADADYDFQEEFRNGAAAARGGGRLTADLLTLHPYLRYAPDDRTEIWAIGGAGRGAAALSRTVTAVPDEADLGLFFGLAGLRRELVSGAGGRLALVADAGGARVAADGGGAVLGGLAARAFRSRLGFEVSRDFGPATPFVEVDALYDGGDGATGVGLEVSGGLRAESAGGRVGVEARGRLLALHSEADYRETGVSMTLRLGPARPDRGLSLDLTPAWGAPVTGAAALGEGSPLTAFGAGAPDAGSVNARASYRLGVLAPYTEWRWDETSSRQAGFGFRLGKPDGAFDLDLLGERRRYRGEPSIYRFSLFGRVEF